MTERARLAWLDVVKGVAILWIAYFHFFKAWANERFGAPFQSGFAREFLAQCAPASSLETVACVARAVFVGASLLGFHAVSVFLLLSGFGLAHSLARTWRPGDPWWGWYRARFLRLYPMYWIAHLLIVVSPFVWRPEPIDGRFWLSLLGDRFWPADTLFYYLNPAWWYFGLLLQLYLVFPPLFLLLVRVGPGVFLALTLFATFACRWIMLVGHPVDGVWVQGAFFGARLFEFTAGMALGWWYQRAPEVTERRLFAMPALILGAALYALGLASYRSIETYVATDALLCCGLFLLLVHLARALAARPRLGAVLATIGVYSYGLYLVHQPYVIELAIRVRDRTMLAAVAAGLAAVAVLTVLSMLLERVVNRATARFFAAKR